MLQTTIGSHLVCLKKLMYSCPKNLFMNSHLHVRLGNAYLSDLQPQSFTGADGELQDCV